jgi:hypothetical protein
MRDLGVVVLVKLVVLGGLWWAFVKDHRVNIGGIEGSLPWMTEATSAPPIAPNATRKAASNDQ